MPPLCDLVVPESRVPSHPLLLLHQILRFAHALFAQTSHAAGDARLALVEASGEVRRMHLWRRSSTRSAEALLLLPVAFFLRGHVRCFATAAFGDVALFMHAAFLHHAFLAHADLLHAAFFVHAVVLTHSPFFIHATILSHSAPLMFAYLLSLLMGLLVRLLLSESLLIMSNGLLAAHGALMQIAKWSADRTVLCVVRMVLGGVRRALCKGWGRRERNRLEWLC